MASRSFSAGARRPSTSSNCSSSTVQGSLVVPTLEQPADTAMAHMIVRARECLRSQITGRFVAWFVDCIASRPVIRLVRKITDMTRMSGRPHIGRSARIAADADTFIPSDAYFEHEPWVAVRSKPGHPSCASRRLARCV